MYLGSDRFSDSRTTVQGISGSIPAISL